MIDKVDAKVTSNGVIDDATHESTRKAMDEVAL